MKIPQKKNPVQKRDKVDIRKYFSPPQSYHYITNPLPKYNTLEINSDYTFTDIKKSDLSSNNNLTNLLTSNETLNLKTETDENNYYPKKYLEYFQTYNKVNRNNYSEKIKIYRESLNDIVKKLNESNNKFKTIINRNTDHKENISLNNNRNTYNEYFTKTPKYTANLYKINKLNNIDSYAYTQKNKNSVIKPFGGKTETRSINRNFYLNNRQKNFTSNNLFDINKENDNNLDNLNKLRNEFKKIRTNYLEVSQQLNILNNSERDNNDITYDEIIKNNSKLNDILIYNYKANNDPENEKVFILMKLRLKNAQIEINKLENEKKKYQDLYDKRNNITKINKNLEKENKSLKLEIEELNNNINLITEELEDSKNKFDNMKIFNKKIQEINAKLTKENKDLKNNNKPKKNNNDSKFKELNEKYKNISEENKNLKTFLKAIQSKYRILQEIHLELKQKSDKEIALLKNEIDNLNKKCQNYEKQINELKNYEKKNYKLKETNKKLVNEKNNIENKNQKVIKNNEENKKEQIKESFCNLYKKYVGNKIKENKLKMIVGIYLQKQNINFNQKIKEYKDKNKKLVKSVRKLNDQIIEFKLNKLNNNKDKEEENNNNL